MFIRLLVLTNILLFSVVQSAVTNSSSKGQIHTANTTNGTVVVKPKQGSLYDDYDLTDQQTLGTNVEGSGGAASLDEYADDEEEEQLSKVTATTSTRSSPTTTTILSTTIPTRTTRRTASTTTATTTTTLSTNKWMKTTLNQEEITKKNQSSTTITSTFNDIDGGEFKDDNEEYADDLEDDSYYNEPTLSTKIILTTSFIPTRYPMLTTRQSISGNHTTPIWMLFSFLTRPPIAAGILAGLAIGILTSIILLVCIVRRYQTREKSHSSYTTGLLYPNQYGYSKSPQEFYA